MPQTDRSKRPKCRWCGRTIIKGMVGWRHKHTANHQCTRQLKGYKQGTDEPRVATPPEGFEVAGT